MKLKIISITLVLCLYLPSAFAEVPSLSLKDSLPIAEAALKKANAELNNYYLYGITFNHSEKGSYWTHIYRPKTASEYSEIFVKVYMSGETELSGGQFSQRRR
jgi:hypothetical protein